MEKEINSKKNNNTMDLYAKIIVLVYCEYLY